MKHFRQISRGVHVGPLNEQLAAHPELWNAITLRRDAPGSPHTGMADIWVRYNDLAPYLARSSLDGLHDIHVPVFYPAWHALPALRSLVFGLMTLVEGEMLGGILITRIPPGGRIDRHVDRGWHVETFAKYYLSLDSAPGARFICSPDGEEPEVLEPETGDVWLFDNRKPHSVENHSARDRVTLIVCIRSTKYGMGP